MRFKQWEQALGVKQPPKSQTRRIGFSYELAVQLWKRGWSYPKPRPRTDKWLVHYPRPNWQSWYARHPVTNAHIAEANRILAEHIITLPVQPGRGKKSVGRIRITKIRRERLGDISEADCLAEGVGYMPQPSVTDRFIPFSVCLICRRLFPSPQLAFACLWNSCSGNWEQDQNDDAWVLEFESGSGL